jgi:hypothetical protein
MGTADEANTPIIYTTTVKGFVSERPRVCLRDKVTAGQVRDVVLKYLSDYPQFRDMPATVLIGLALHEAFPC